MGKMEIACVVSLVVVFVGVAVKWRDLLLKQLRRKGIEKKRNNRPEKPWATFEESIASKDKVVEEEEELPPLELRLFCNRNILLNKNGGMRDYFWRQAIVVINNQDLQKVNSTWKRRGYSNEIITPHFCHVNPSAQTSTLHTVDIGSDIYLFGYGPYNCNMWCLDANRVVFEPTKEDHLRELAYRQHSSYVCRSPVTDGKRIYSFGEEGAIYGEVYDINDNRWSYFKDLPPFDKAYRCTIVNYIMWDSKEKKMIVLFVQKRKIIYKKKKKPPKKKREKMRKERLEKEEKGEETEKEKEKEEEKQVIITQVMYYDLREEKWTDIVTIEDDDGMRLSMYDMVVVKDIVFIIEQSQSSLYRYDLGLKKMTGKIEGLTQMDELMTSNYYPLDDVVYLSSSSDNKFHKLCIFWISFTMERQKYLNFALMKVGEDDGENKLTGS